MFWIQVICFYNWPSPLRHLTDEKCTLRCLKTPGWSVLFPSWHMQRGGAYTVMGTSIRGSFLVDRNTHSMFKESVRRGLMTERCLSLSLGKLPAPLLVCHSPSLSAESADLSRHNANDLLVFPEDLPPQVSPFPFWTTSWRNLLNFTGTPVQ